MHSASNASKIDDEQPRSWKLSGGGGGGNFCPRASAQTVARGINCMATHFGCSICNAFSLAGNTNSPMMTAGLMRMFRSYTHTGRKTPGGAGTHTYKSQPRTGHTRETRAHTGTRTTQTNLTTIETHEHTRTTARPWVNASQVKSSQVKSIHKQQTTCAR